MIVVRLKSGMGNQMFQYAFGQRVAKELGIPVHYDLSSLLDRSKGPDFVYRDFDLGIFKLALETTHPEWLLKSLSYLKSNRVTRYFRERVLEGRSYVKEDGFHFQEDLIRYAKDETVYEGWFQSYKYLDGQEDQIRRDFQFLSPVLDDSLPMLDEILARESVCLNVRRTDFVQNSNLNVTDLNYFKRGVDYMADSLDDPTFFIFSDDIPWCREHLELEHPTFIVDHRHKGKKFSNYMQLMTRCKHFIIPNSSFAWWAAWLCDHEEKLVVIPERWFNDPSIVTRDVSPSDWIRL